MQNIRYKLIPLSDLQPHVQTELDAEIQSHSEALRCRGKDYETAQDMAIKRAGCEVIFVGDEAVLCKRQMIRSTNARVEKRNVKGIREGVIRRVA